MGVRNKIKPCSYCGTIEFRPDKIWAKCDWCHTTKLKTEFAWWGEQGLVVCHECWNSQYDDNKPSRAYAAISKGKKKAGQ